MQISTVNNNSREKTHADRRGTRDARRVLWQFGHTLERSKQLTFINNTFFLISLSLSFLLHLTSTSTRARHLCNSFIPRFVRRSVAEACGLWLVGKFGWWTGRASRSWSALQSVHFCIINLSPSVYGLFE